MKSRILIVITTIIFLIVSCTPTAPEPTPTPIPTPLPTAKPAPEPIAGTVFWDANGSGLMDETSFIVPNFDPTNPPYFFELLEVNGTDTSAFVEGELVTVPEPPIRGIEVCLSDTCTETNADGSFNLQPEKAQDTYYLKFTDPNADNPTRAFRYINQWNGPVVIESYEMNEVTVPEQHLNDTKLIDISKGISYTDEDISSLGFIQGFLTLPFNVDMSDSFYIWNYFDIDNDILSCDSPVPRNGKEINYDGRYRLGGGGNPISPVIGVGDSHTGLDYSVDIGSKIVSSSPLSKVWFLPNPSDGEIRVHTLFNQNSTIFKNTYAHLDTKFVELEDQLYRGQFLGFSGNTGSSPYHQLHFDLSRSRPDKCTDYIDPYRATINPEDTVFYSGSEYTFWTVDNIPQFP